MLLVLLCLGVGVIVGAAVTMFVIAALMNRSLF